MIHERVFSGVMFSSAVIYSWFYLTSHDFIKLLSRVVTVSFSFYIACVLCLSLLVSSFFWFLESRKTADSVNLQQAAHPKRRWRVTRVWWSDPCSGVTRMAVCEGQGAMHRLCSPVDRNMVWSGGWQFCQTSLHSDFKFSWRRLWMENRRLRLCLQLYALQSLFTTASLCIPAWLCIQWR